ncbi:hypothetical protein [Streptomyces flavofungini]|uniref:Integral membrane protein n=1 Tax=Streptomyces flavofungini TaxID=68200 RepID=A0ABS0WXB7_9ACTN|nr:hypothetical protein [Streptomyces flavofungini]MBJ3805571.1 hypothetical protein [Streptomyces flavofungini]GHC73123.1 hypothetical protein GCM10010349_50580 [Streptomyces flavofungini]
MNGPTQVSAIGRWSAVWLYAVVAGLCLAGPFLLGLTLVAGKGVLAVGIVCTVVLVPVGLLVWVTVAAERKHNRRLDAVGVPAVAEVIGLTEWDSGDDAGAVVVLRLSGPGFRAFEATWKRSPHPALRVGLRLDAVVDPAERLYRVEL